MKRTALWLWLSCASLVAACSNQSAPNASQQAAAPAAAASAKSGIDLQYIDASVRAQDNFYRHVNGKWLDTVEIPADKSRYGTGAIVFDSIQDKLHGLVDDAVAGKLSGTNADTKKIGDLYASFMDEAALDALDIKPLAAQFALIDGLKDAKGIPALIAA